MENPAILKILSVTFEVILSIDAFQALLEDMQDLAIRTQRLDEETISHSELLKELKADGIL